MSITVRTRMVGDVAVIYASGRITLGEGSLDLRNAVRQIVEDGRRKILLNLSDVSYLDTSGIGELLYAWRISTKRGVALKLLFLTRKVEDLLQITRYYSAFDIFNDESVAMQSFDFSLHCRCPSCGSLCGPPCVDSKLLTWDEQMCSGCSARFVVHNKGPLAQDGRLKYQDCTILVDDLRVTTYEKEYFQILPGHPYIVKIVGRLDLFASSTLGMAWKTIPEPRRAIFDLSRAADIDAPGWEALLRFVEKKKPSAKIVISLEGLKGEVISGFIPAPEIYRDRKTAIDAFGDLADTPPWLCEIEGGNT